MGTAVEPLTIQRTASATSSFDAVLAGGIALTIFAAVLAFGATQTVPIYGFEVGCAVLFVTCWTSMVTRCDFAAFRTPLMAPILLFAVVVTIQIAFGRTAYAWATRTEALRYFAYFCLFVTSSHTFRSRSVAKGFLNALIVFGTLVAIEAIAQDLSAPGLIYWKIPVPASGTTYGPFASHGLYAGFMELVAGVAIMKWLSTSKSDSKWLLWGFCAAVTSSSIVLSRSRAGMLALTAEVIVASILFARRSDRTAKALIAVFAIVILAISAWIGSSALLHQATSIFDPLNKDVNGHRLTIAADGLRMFRAKPLFGWGLDVFPVSYPRYRSFATNTFINAAHNDYIQVLVETGIVGAAAVAMFIVLLYRTGLSRLSRRKESLNWVVAGALVACTGMFVHNAFDFNFHITADAALFYVLAAIVTAPSRAELQLKQPPPHVLDLTATN